MSSHELKLIGRGLTQVLVVSSVAAAMLAEAQDPRESYVSLIQLIANPKEFDNKHVMVKGFVVLEFESQRMYLSDADAKHIVTRNSVWLSVDEAIYERRSDFNRRYVLVEGTFVAKGRAHLGFPSGEIRDIKRFQVQN